MTLSVIDFVLSPAVSGGGHWPPRPLRHSSLHVSHHCVCSLNIHMRNLGAIGVFFEVLIFPKVLHKQCLTKNFIVLAQTILSILWIKCFVCLDIPRLYYFIHDLTCASKAHILV